MHVSDPKGSHCGESFDNGLSESFVWLGFLQFLHVSSIAQFIQQEVSVVLCEVMVELDAVVLKADCGGNKYFSGYHLVVSFSVILELLFDNLIDVDALEGVNLVSESHQNHLCKASLAKRFDDFELQK